MQPGIHPSELAEKFAARRAALLSAWSFGGLCLLMLSLQGLSNIARDRALLCGGAVALGSAAQYQRKQARRMSAHLQDIEDISGDAYQSWLYRQMQPAAGRLEVSAPQASLPLFDWTALADPDEHPTLAIISPMGGGKSRLAKYLAKHVLFPGQTPELRAIDIYGRPTEWQDAALVTDHDAMLEMMRSDLEAIGQRVGAFRQGQDNFAPLFWIFEEAPDTIGTLRKSSKAGDELVTAWVTKATTVARKVKARLCLVSVRLSGSEIGVSAEARNDATVIFPGRKGIAKAMADDRIFKLGSKQNRELREQLTASLKGVKRPALVHFDGQWFPATVPEIDALGNPPGHRAPQSPPAAPSWDWTKLEELYELDCPEREESPLSEMALKLSSYLEKRGRIELRTLAKNWGRNQGLTQPELIALVTELERHGNIAVSGETLEFLGFDG